MLHRLRRQIGQGMVEMIVTITVITIAILTLGAAFDEAFLSLHMSARKSAAANLGEQQLELYAAIPYADYSTQLGLDSTALTAVKANDPTYVSDEAALTPSGTDVSITCGTTANCMPEQCTPAATCTYPLTLTENPTGSDGRHYKVETFIRTVTQTTSEYMVTVIVRDPNQTGSPILFEASNAFDACHGC